MKLAWITGAQGLIGHQLLRLAPQLAPDWTVRGLARSDLDLLDAAAVEREFLRDRPQLVLHCAAQTVVAEVQKNPGLARRINVEATRHLAALAADLPFVFFSTDLVFDGRRGHYSETDPVNPLTAYGATKVEAEQAVLRSPRHLVVRTSINAGVSLTGQRSFSEQLRRSLQNAGAGMKLFVDEFRCPIAAVETARAVWDLALQGATGVYHVAGAKRMSRYEIARLLVARWPEITAQVETGFARDFPGPPRALDTSLDISKAQARLTRPLSAFDEWLQANPGEPV